MIKIKLSDLLGKERMTRKKLSELIDARPNTICDMYNENIKRIDLGLLNDICRVLKCEVSDILEYIDEPK